MTPAEQHGLSVGTRIRVVDAFRMGASSAGNNDILCLKRDDGTNNPYFYNESRACACVAYISNGHYEILGEEKEEEVDVDKQLLEYSELKYKDKNFHSISGATLRTEVLLRDDPEIVEKHCAALLWMNRNRETVKKLLDGEIEWESLT